jgi:hypothetical protein
MGTGTSGGRRSPPVCHQKREGSTTLLDERRMNAGGKIFPVVVSGITTVRFLSGRASTMRP